MSAQCASGGPGPLGSGIPTGGEEEVETVEEVEEVEVEEVEEGVVEVVEEEVYIYRGGKERGVVLFMS